MLPRVPHAMRYSESCKTFGFRVQALECRWWVQDEGLRTSRLASRVGSLNLGDSSLRWRWVYLGCEVCDLEFNSADLWT